MRSSPGSDPCVESFDVHAALVSLPLPGNGKVQWVGWVFRKVKDMHGTQWIEMKFSYCTLFFSLQTSYLTFSSSYMFPSENSLPLNIFYTDAPFLFSSTSFTFQFQNLREKYGRDLLYLPWLRDPARSYPHKRWARVWWGRGTRWWGTLGPPCCWSSVWIISWDTQTVRH